MQKLVDENHDFHTFKTRTIPSNNQFYNDFQTWLSRIDKNVLKNISNKSLWLRHLMDFETNYVYRVWYGQKPSTSDIDNGLREYLKKEYPKYYRKIENVEKTGISKLFTFSK
jgi:hypothetical protein